MVAMLHNLDAFITIEKLFLQHQGIFPNTLVRPPVSYKLDMETRTELLLLFEQLKADCGMAG